MTNITWSNGKLSSKWSLQTMSIATAKLRYLYHHTKLMHKPGVWSQRGSFNIKIRSYKYRKSYCTDKTIIILSYLHNGISYPGNMTSCIVTNPWCRVQVHTKGSNCLLYANSWSLTLVISGYLCVLLWLVANRETAKSALTGVSYSLGQYCFWWTSFDIITWLCGFWREITSVLP